jgi:hypothetical protein
MLPLTVSLHVCRDCLPDLVKGTGGSGRGGRVAIEVIVTLGTTMSLSAAFATLEKFGENTPNLIRRSGVTSRSHNFRDGQSTCNPTWWSFMARRATANRYRGRQAPRAHRVLNGGRGRQLTAPARCPCMDVPATSRRGMIGCSEHVVAKHAATDHQAIWTQAN